MIDLSTNTTNLYEIKTIEGDILKIKKPSQMLFNKMANVQKNQNEIEVIAQLYEIFLEILNLNTNGKKFDMSYVEQFDVTVVGMVLKDYFEFVGEELGKL